MSISIRAGTSNDGYLQVNGSDVMKLVAGGTVAGQRDSTVATMKMFADEFGASLVQGGWQKLPSGLIMQWGYATVPGSNAQVQIPLPIAFTTGGIAASATVAGPGYSNAVLGISFANTSSVYLTNASPSGAQGVWYFVLGK